MDGYFYINDKEGNIYELTLTTDMQISYQSSVSQFPVEDGSSIVDHVNLKPTSLSYSGFVSNIVNVSLKDPKNHPSVSENVRSLLELHKTREPFTVHYDSRNVADDSYLPPLENCVFRKLDFSRRKNHSDSYLCSLEVTQIILTEAAKLTTEIKESDLNQSEGLSDNSANSTKEVDVKKLSTTAPLNLIIGTESVSDGDK